MSSSRPRQTARRGGHPGPTRERIRLPLVAPPPIDHRTPGRRAALSQALSKLEEAKTQSQSASSSKLEADKTEPEAGLSTSSTTKKYRVSAASLGRYHGPRPHPQKQSQFLDELPAEILDKIFGDETLNARDHLALSGTCMAIRLGYSEQLWDEMEPNAKTPFAHNAFTHDLLHNPGYLNTCASLSEPNPNDLDSKSVGQIDRIWSNALARAANKSVKPGINFKAPCWKARHKTCSCMRTNATLGPSHSKVISNVNNYKTSWGTMTYHYRTLMDFVNDWDYKSERKINPRGEQTDMFCLATVDAAILEKAGGPWRAWKKFKAAQKKPRKRKRADSDSE